MRILICPDSFKGTLSAIEVAEIIGSEFKKAGHDCILMPIADGGEGTVDILLYELGGQKQLINVRNPLGKEIEAYYGLNGGQAYLEMAQSSGLHTVSEGEKNPWLASTFGLGQMIKDALDHQVREIFIGIGGSATNDVGIGMAQALGVRFLDQDGKEIIDRQREGYGASILAKIMDIDATNLDPRIAKTKIKVWSDVRNPLYGEHGASFTYSKQKGATAEMILKLEEGVIHIDNIIKKLYKIDTNFPGAGAAGGLGAGLKVFLQAEIISGIVGMIKLLQLEQKVKKADLVVVGEGQMDWQTAFGKAPAGIAKLAKKFKKNVIAIVGKIGKDVHKNYQIIDHIFSCYGEGEVNFDEVKRNCRQNLQDLCQIVLEKINQIDSYQYQLTILP
jgi:glycerate kinase